MGYLHIDNLYKTQDILFLKECYAMEKVHGTSTHLTFQLKEDGTVNLDFFSGGCTHEHFISLFDREALSKIYLEKYSSMNPLIIYGEGYGGKMQGMSHTYGPDLRFIAFDVKGNNIWRNVGDAERIVNAFGLEFVPYHRISTDLTAIDAERDRSSEVAVRRGILEPKEREGVVLRPLEEFTKNNGERLISKHKRSKFQERMNQPKVKDVDPTKIEKMKGAQAIADEWVTPMRFQHVLDKLQKPLAMEHTKLYISAMIEDVLREAAGEIEESGQLKGAIAKKTVQIAKDLLQQSLLNKG